MKRRVLLIGGSRGIGLAAAAHLEPRCANLWCVSRSPSPHGQWIAADLSSADGIEAVISRLANEQIDALLYLGGMWEHGAFTSDYAFENSLREEIGHVIAVNLVAPVKLVHGLLPNLRRSTNPRVVFIGSLSGLENTASREVANSASKYGLRGAAHALAKELPSIPMTVINPGNVSTQEVEADIAEGRVAEQVPIPMSDLLATIDYVLSLSSASVASEVNLSQVR